MTEAHSPSWLSLWLLSAITRDTHQLKKEASFSDGYQRAEDLLGRVQSVADVNNHSEVQTVNIQERMLGACPPLAHTGEPGLLMKHYDALARAAEAASQGLRAVQTMHAVV